MMGNKLSNLLLKPIGIIFFAILVMTTVYFLGGRTLQWASFFATIVLGLLPTILGTGGRFDLTVDINRSVDSQHNTTVTQPNSGPTQWSDAPEENLETVENDPMWRKAGGANNDLWGSISSLLYKTSNKLQDSGFLDESRIKSLLIVIMVVGYAWFSVILIELFGSTSLSIPLFSTLSAIIPLEYTVRNFPIVRIIASLLLLILPIAYINRKSVTTCESCDKPFALTPVGRYWHPSLKEVRETETGQTIIYNGVLFRRCKYCDRLYQDTNYQWKEKTQ